MPAEEGLPLELSGLPEASAPASGRVRGRYLHPIEHYVGTYERSLRLLKGWIADGRDAEEAAVQAGNAPDALFHPPFDHPERMLAWWQRVKTNRAPEVLIRLAVRGSGKPADASTATTTGATTSASTAATASTATRPTSLSSAPAAAALPAPVVHAPVLPTIDLAGPALGFAALLERMRLAEATAGTLHLKLLQDAVAATDPDQRLRLQAAAEQAKRDWQDFIPDLRKAEGDAPKILSAQGKSWESASVMAAIEAYHIIQKSSILGMLRRARPFLKACTTTLEEDALWIRETDTLFATWSPEQFAARLAADAA